MSQNSGYFRAVLFFSLTHAMIGVFSGLFLALPEEVLFSTILIEKEGFFFFFLTYAQRSDEFLKFLKAQSLSANFKLLGRKNYPHVS